MSVAKHWVIATLETKEVRGYMNYFNKKNSLIVALALGIGVSAMGCDTYYRDDYRNYGRYRYGDDYRYDRFGYDRYGYDRDGYDRYGFNRRGYSRYGFSDRYEYDRYGRYDWRYNVYGRRDRDPRYGRVISGLILADTLTRFTGISNRTLLYI